MKVWAVGCVLTIWMIPLAHAYEDCPAIDMSGVEWSRMRISESGRGDDSTRPLGFKAGHYRFEYQYRGGTNFIIWMKTRRDQRELVVNRIGSGKGASTVRLECDDEVWFDIETHGNWKISFEKMR